VWLLVQDDIADKETLGLINAYNPGLSSAWMLQKAMSVRVGEKVDRNLINKMLCLNFASMAQKGDSHMKPFLQDVMRWGPFASTVFGQMQRDPLFLPVMFRHVGFVAIVDWFRHFVALGMYDIAHQLIKPRLSQLLKEQRDVKARFRLKRWAEALEYGSGHDYDHHP
jgi:hypothetical protein